MATEISKRAAEQSRIAMTRSRLHEVRADPLSLSDEERADYRKLRLEIQADTDLDDDPRYAPLLAALAQRVGRRLAYGAIFTPERLLPSGVTHPLYNAEVEQLLRALGAIENCDARTVERMVTDGVVPQPPQIGRGDLMRNAYFARHVLVIAYRVLFVPEDREDLRHDVRVASGQVSPQAVTLLRTLPSVDPRFLRRR